MKSAFLIISDKRVMSIEILPRSSYLLPLYNRTTPYYSFICLSLPHCNMV